MVHAIIYDFFYAVKVTKNKSEGVILIYDKLLK